MFIKYGNFLACPRTPDIFEQPKILIREAGATITAALDMNNNYVMSSLYNCILIDKSFSLKYLLALINSPIYQHLMNKLTFEKTKGAFTKAKIYHYYELPVKVIGREKQAIFDEMVTKIMSNVMHNMSIDELEKKLNHLLFHLYDLTYEEVLIIDPKTTISKEDYEDLTYGN